MIDGHFDDTGEAELPATCDTKMNDYNSQNHCNKLSLFRIAEPKTKIEMSNNLLSLTPFQICQEKK